MTEKQHIAVSVRTVVEYALLSGSLLPGGALTRMREGMLGHQARQKSLTDAQTEVTVRGEAHGEIAVLDISGRIDVLLTRDDIPVVEEIKLAPSGEVPQAAVPVHRAQAVCYGHMLGVPQAIIRVLYVRMDGSEVASFEERLNADALREAFEALTKPYLQKVEGRLRWMQVRDASIEGLPFPFVGYRAGQREMSVQAYWAIKSKKRLFVQAPTGIGKTAAALFPALKALGDGCTGQVFYLTARTTAQQNAAQALNRMRQQGLRVRALCMTAKEKSCPCRAGEGPWRCDLLTCPYADGFYDRLPGALADMRQHDDWSRDAMQQVAAGHQVCPFEFGLSLCEEADVVIGDYNYAFDPGARIRRIFQWTTNLTLLVDEAHNLPDRTRDMLSAALDSRELRETRRMVGKTLGRKVALYAELTALIRWLEAQPAGVCHEAPDALSPLLESCMDAALPVLAEAPLGDLSRMLIAGISTLGRFDEHYAVLTETKGKHTQMLLYCLDPAPHLLEATQKLRGTVYFSATLSPLPAWREAIGGTQEDGLLSLASPFPDENLLVLRYPVTTKYKARQRTAADVAAAILAVAGAKPGNYLACFPSYAYLRQVQEALLEIQPGALLHVQQSGMNEAARAAYLEAFAPRAAGSLIGMVVLGGVFGEGVDLPGERLSGVVIVGVGLPQIGAERDVLRDYYDGQYGDGFAQAYRIPGMNKVLQAVGRVIRTETDRGVALLIDDRFLQQDYAALMPPWWAPADVAYSAQEIAERSCSFWQNGYST